MRIEENKVFLFNFDSAEMCGGCSFPIRANSREEAVQILQSCLGRFNAELSMEFPRVSTATMAGASDTPHADMIMPLDAADGLTGVLLERIDSLMKDLGGGELIGDARAKTIHNWTELDFAPANYASIIHELELITSGAKELPIKGKKK